MVAWPRIAVLAAVATLMGCAAIPPPRWEMPRPDWTLRAPDLPLLGASDEERVAAVLENVRRGMEQRRIYQVLAHVSPNYVDDEGRDYEDIRAYLAYVFENYSEIAIHRVQPRIVVRGNRARAVETFGTRAEPADPDRLPLDVQGQVLVDLVKEDGAWRIIEWGRLM
jgi:hypothetical protein